MELQGSARGTTGMVQPRRRPPAPSANHRCDSAHCVLGAVDVVFQGRARQGAIAGWGKSFAAVDDGHGDVWPAAEILDLIDTTLRSAPRPNTIALLAWKWCAQRVDRVCRWRRVKEL
jgi:hypothetical protein